MGEGQHSRFRFGFNGSLRFDGRPDLLSADAGVVLLREVDERSNFSAALAAELHDTRNADLITHPLPELLRTRIYAIAAGWRDQDDLDLLRNDAAMRLGVSERAGDSPLRAPAEGVLAPDGLASQPTQSRLIEMLTVGDNTGVLHRALLGQAVAHHRRLFAGRQDATVTVDVDSTPVDAYGSQAGVEWNGHYHRECFHPLVAMLSETQDWVDAALRPGACHTSVGTEEFVVQVVDALRAELGHVDAVRGDAGFPSGKILGFLDDEVKVHYVFRLPTNERLEKLAAPFLRRPPDEPAREGLEWFHELSYKAHTWDGARRVVLVVIDCPGELFPKHFFLVTSWTPEQKSGPDLLDFYRQRATLEAHIGEFKDVFDPALSSTTRPKSHVRGQEPKKRRAQPRDDYACNQVNLLLYALAHNLVNVAREVLGAATGSPCSARRFRESVLNVAGRFTLHARRVVLVLGLAVATLWVAFAHALDVVLPLAPPTLA